MVHTTSSKVLLTTTLRPLVGQLSGLLARGVQLIDQFLHTEPTPQKQAEFERELSLLICEVGRRIMAWVLNRVAPESNDEAPSRLRCEGRLYRRRRQYRSAVSTLLGTVEVWRRLYEPLERGGRSIHPLELRLGVEAGLATPALTAHVGRWAADHTQRQVLEMLEANHHVHWSHTSLRKLLASLSTGMAPHRRVSQVTQVVSWLEQARASKGRYRPGGRA
jgi:hypothetical protein